MYSKENRKKPLSGKYIPCLYCKQEVYLPPYRQKYFKFCSRKCGWHYKAEYQKAYLSCVICSQTFSVIAFRAQTAKYCSPQCYHKSLKNKGHVEFKCKHCDKIFNDSPSRNRVYCSRECVNKANKKIWKPTFSTVRKAMKARGLLIKCEDCGYNETQEILGVHHKDGNHSNNLIGNLIVLCPNCHSLRHRKHIVHGWKTS